MNNKVKILTAVVGVIVVGLGVGVTLLQPKTTDIQEPIVPIVVEVEEIDVETAVETIEETEEVEPTPEEIGEPDTIEVAEPEPTPVAVAVAEAEPTPVAVAVAEPEPTPVAVAEPEPTPVAIAEPEPTPVAVAEPEPTPVAVAEPEPTPVAVAEPVVAEAIASVSSGQTYTTVYNGVEYTVTQEQMDRSFLEGFGYLPVDGIPARVFSNIANAGVVAGGDNLTSEEFAAQKTDSSNFSDTIYKWG